MTDREACLALNLLPKIGPVRVRKLIDTLGTTPLGILSATRSELRSVSGIGPDTAEAVANWRSTIDLERELRRIDELGLHVLTWSDPTYPADLRETYDPPLVLYIMGEVLERDRHAVAIVGSRRTTTYGLSTAKKFGFQLSHAGMTVISGLARGIDTAAHEGALAGGGRTIAVIGSGLGQLYPPENRPLAEKIASEGRGAIVSEFPVDYPPDKQSFPLRNRIVAGWCQGLCVIEAPARSGALITAGQATELGRTIFAVPGQIDRPGSAGSNRLIQEGARLVMDGGEILDELGGLFPSSTVSGAEKPTRVPLDLTVEERAIFDALGEEEALVDQLVSRSGLSPSAVSTTLLRLQMKRLVQALPGNYFVKRI